MANVVACVTRRVRWAGWASGAAMSVGLWAGLWVAAGPAAGVAGAQPVAGQAPAESATEATTDPVSALLTQLDPAVLSYHNHVTTLASPYFEGRLSGARGGERAADYLEHNYRMLGLEPAFGDSYRQEMPWRERTELVSAEAGYRASGRRAELEQGSEFSVLSFAGSGRFNGPVVFTGYGITRGPSEYTSFPPEDLDLSGKAAVVLRFEPMGETGRSTLTPDGEWSFAASLAPKLQGLKAKNAAAIVLVTPPMADHPRAKAMEDMDSIRGVSLGIPVIQMSWDAASAMFEAAGDEAMTLTALKARADASEAVVAELPRVRAQIEAQIDVTPTTTPNLGAILPGVGELADEYVVITAHYDHVGYGQFGATPEAGPLHPGADDNASGTSGMLVAAETLAKRWADDATTPRRSILFIGFTAEESGLNGSRYYVDNAIAPLDKHYINLNMDMIGRVREGVVQIGGVNTGAGLEEALKPVMDASPLDIIPDVSVGLGRSDHASFHARSVPALFVFTGLHEDYHQPGDTADKINRVGAVAVVELVTQMAVTLATRTEPMPWAGGASNDQPAPARSRVRVGIQPNYVEGVEGILVDNVTDGTSAAEGGIKQGDIIIEWGGTAVPTIEAWMPLLAEHEPGDQVKIKVKRGTETLELTLTLKASRTRGS